MARRTARGRIQAQKMIELHEGLEIREIPGEPGFFAREDGTIWTEWQNRARGRIKANWQRAQKFVSVVIGPNSMGYVQTRLWTGHRYVHIIMLEAFVGPCPWNMECCHEDGNPANNALTNIRWDTSQANTADCRRHGRLTGGVIDKAHHWNKNNGKLAFCREAILRMLAEGRTYRDIADSFDVSSSAVYVLVNGGY